jgi:hypothetical protein
VQNAISTPGRPFIMLSTAHSLLLMNMPDLAGRVYRLVAPFDHTLLTRDWKRYNTGKSWPHPT